MAQQGAEVGSLYDLMGRSDDQWQVAEQLVVVCLAGQDCKISRCIPASDQASGIGAGL